ncbi:echinoidin-like [Patiria miniata]|uniref:C-type lectin domain-containing protein n=1 Tax=Patiria miniata TaxID=46514 RepID=A0A914BGL5_PATMI|nr:echinoidin-like [Patiria miniata]
MKLLLIIVAILFVTGLSQACCPPLWSQFRGGRCYRYVGIPLTWFEAREYCYNLNPGKSFLVTVNSEEEATHIHKIFEENGAEKAVSYWIGLRDFHWNQRRFEWDDGTLFKDSSYTFWQPGEPNNHGELDCVEVYRSNRRWNDHGCLVYKRPFICEMKRQN